jgi:hypothetical protein
VNRTNSYSGWEISSRRRSATPAHPSYTTVPRTEGCTYAAKGALSFIQGPFSVAPCQTRTVRFATFTSL